jgi:hypothetical protein
MGDAVAEEEDRKGGALLEGDNGSCDTSNLDRSQSGDYVSLLRENKREIYES